MAKLAYCKVCKATYPLNVVHPEGNRSGRVKEAVCPMGHAQVEVFESPGTPRDKT
jgi:hypothetical protein